MDKIKTPLRSESKRIIESLRVGTVPDEVLLYIAEGREEELEEINRIAIDIRGKKAGGIKFIRGEYGTGKTFLLSWIKNIYLKNDFAASQMCLTSAYKFNKPVEIYNQFMNGLLIGENKLDFLEYVDSKKEQIDLKDLKSIMKYSSTWYIVFKKLVNSLKSGNDRVSDAAFCWLKGEETLSRELKNQLGVVKSLDSSSAFENLKAVIHFLALMKIKGTFILIDEVEAISIQPSNIREKSYENIRKILDMSYDGSFNGCAWILAGTHSLFDDDLKGIPSYKALYDRIYSSDENKNIKKPILDLYNLNQDVIYHLAYNLTQTHKKVYRWRFKLDREIVDKYVKAYIEGSKDKYLNNRAFVESYINILDICSSKNNIEEMLEKTKELKESIEYNEDEIYFNG